MSDPAISVVMPVYNARPYLAEAVESVLGQTCGDFELLLIDDGSTDGSREDIEGFKDRRVRLFLREHAGLINVLNFGLAEARAPVIARMDSDDVSLPERFERQLAFLRAHPEVVVLGTRVRFIDAEGRPIRDPFAPPEEHEDLVRALVDPLAANPIFHPSAMFRREAALACGGYRTPFVVCEDWDFWVRIARLGRLHVLPEVLLLLRKHGQNVTAVQLARNIAGNLRARVCHGVWQATGVDMVDQAPDLWRRAERRVEEQMEARRLVQAMQARGRLVEGIPGDPRRHPVRVLGRMLRRPGLVRGLGAYRLRKEVLDRIVAEMVEEVRRQDIAPLSSGPGPEPPPR